MSKSIHIGTIKVAYGNRLGLGHTARIGSVHKNKKRDIKRQRAEGKAGSNRKSANQDS